MCHRKLPVLLILLSVTLSCRDAAPIDRLEPDAGANRTAAEGKRTALQNQHTLSRPINQMPQLETTKGKSHQMEKRKCNTATCVTQRLADFLVRSNNNFGAIYSPTNVGSYTYGKRDTAGLRSRGSFDYLQH
ncbi:islet amyloid polypeptide [Ascaphus truei]|uniref:islet amyloid polypeptide n=1 Tax=Ascaphus truei TaxID=8439 RepID=UPI003F5A3A54